MTKVNPRNNNTGDIGSLWFDYFFVATPNTLDGGTPNTSKSGNSTAPESLKTAPKTALVVPLAVTGVLLLFITGCVIWRCRNFQRLRQQRHLHTKVTKGQSSSHSADTMPYGDDIHLLPEGGLQMTVSSHATLQIRADLESNADNIPLLPQRPSQSTATGQFSHASSPQIHDSHLVNVEGSHNTFHVSGNFIQQLAASSVTTSATGTPSPYFPPLPSHSS